MYQGPIVYEPICFSEAGALGNSNMSLPPLSQVSFSLFPHSSLTELVLTLSLTHMIASNSLCGQLTKNGLLAVYKTVKLFKNTMHPCNILLNTVCFLIVDLFSG